MLDPRLTLVNERFKSIGRIIPVISSKGGVGKSLVSTSLALAFGKQQRVGLLDLDFWGASDHLLLGPIDVTKTSPEEQKGILPVEVAAIRFMSVIWYTRNNPLPIRGREYKDIFVELMAVTRWDELDYLVIDMPPGLGDPLLDLLHWVKKGEFLIVATPSRLAVNVVSKTLEFCRDQRLSILGLVENMSDSRIPPLNELAERFNVSYLGEIPFYSDIEDYIGSVDRLMESDFFRTVEKMAGIIEKIPSASK